MKNELGNMEWYDSTLKTGTFYLHAIGEEFCLPLHFNGPKIRERLLFHFIVSGKGILKMKDNVWHLTANQGFIIPDSSIVFYQADKKDPWHYFWLRLTSEDADAFYKSLSLSPENPVYNARQNNEIYPKFKALFRAVSKDNTNPLTVTSVLYAFLAELQASSLQRKDVHVTLQEEYALRARLYILNQYHKESLTIAELSTHIGLNRSYLTRLFKSVYQTSPQDFLIQVRMNKAKDLLQKTNFPVTIIGNSVGYSDVFTFSKTYKKIFGISPTEERKKLKTTIL